MIGQTVLANIRPAGEFLMEDFFYAGGLPDEPFRGSRPSTASQESEVAPIQAFPGLQLARPFAETRRWM